VEYETKQEHFKRNPWAKVIRPNARDAASARAARPYAAVTH
jgi:hypothetical protein